MTNVEEFAGLAGTGFQGREATKPEDEFFHSVYIAGQTRKNHINIEEQAGLLQVRGVQYNLKEIHFVITHVKEVLAKVKNTAKGDTIECFSYKKGEAPWHGTSKLQNGSFRPCGVTSAERAANEYCSPCRTQIIVSGIFCDSNGKPVVDENQKPVMIFLRGKGTKYNNISAYLTEMARRDLEPIFTPVTDESRKFEKDVVNNKRFLTKVTIGEAKSNFGIKKVFVLEPTLQLPKESVFAILKVAKNTLAKFEEKMDWSKTKTASSYTAAEEGILSMDGPQGDKPAEGTQAPSQPAFKFDDLDFNS